MPEEQPVIRIVGWVMSSPRREIVKSPSREVVIGLWHQLAFDGFTISRLHAFIAAYPLCQQFARLFVSSAQEADYARELQA